jgi:aminoglycoside phosphotransferase (APT) family kinase protein
MAALIQRLLAEDRARYTSLVHGDAHLGNVCILPGENACFLDWQTAMLGFWPVAVGFFVWASVMWWATVRPMATLSQAGGTPPEGTE